MATDCNASRTYPDLNKKETTQRFVGYVVVVSGGCSGIGRATVERFANDGATVYALDIKVQGEEELTTMYGDMVTCVTLDISDNKRCRDVVTEIAAKHDNIIHTLFNCAVYFGSRDLDATYVDWRMSFDVNVVGFANMVQAVEPFMKKGNFCSIINMASVRGHNGMPKGWTYSATKGAILTMTRCMANDLREKDIRVNSVSPSTIWTNAVANVTNYKREPAEADWGKTVLRGRIGEVEEVAAVVSFLASRDANYVNGVDIPVDDGFLAMGVVGKGEFLNFTEPDF